MSVNRRCIALLTMLFLILISAGAALAQNTAFTYQGRLQDGGTPANGAYDLQFKLFDTATVGTGTQVGSTITKSAITVTNGSLSAQLDFGANAFPGTDRFLEIGVRLAGGGSFTTLSPRQPVTSTPYAIRSASAATADTATTATSATITTKFALLALLRWDLLTSKATFPAGTGPYGIAFDGTNIWVANNGSNNVTRLSAAFQSSAAQGKRFVMGVSINTISFHMRRIYEKLQVHSKSEAVAKALRDHLVS